jgi:hypothetical protein
MASTYIPPYGHRHIPPGSSKDKLLRKHLDASILKDYEYFVNKVNERTLYQRGILSTYNDGGNPALGLEVEYFHPSITADDRMVYIMENIVSLSSLDWRNIIGNTVISHFYGARGVHSVLTQEKNPKKAHIDFLTLAEEQQVFKKTGKVGAYTLRHREIAIQAKKNKQKVWGTTELHTSLQTAGRRFVNGWYRGEPRHEDKGTWLNICEWIASWVHLPSKYDSSKTVMEGLAGATTLKEGYLYLTGETMIGEYYGYHCSTSNSVNPRLNFNHDDTFVAPGPGARETLDLMFPKLTTRQVSYGDRVVWIRENQHKILNINFHQSLWNYTTSNGVTIFKDKQNELKSYGTEVSLCQYSVYCRLRSNPELISRRKVARSAVPCQTMVKHPSLKEKKEMSTKSFFNVIAEVFKKKAVVAKVPESSVNEDSGRELSKDTTVPPAAVIETEVTLETAGKEKDLDFSVTNKEEIILKTVKTLSSTFTHNDVLKSIKTQRLDYMFKLDSSWKETWAIMQELVKKDVLRKEGRNYRLK